MTLRPAASLSKVCAFQTRALIVTDLDPQASAAAGRHQPGDRPAVIAIPHTRLAAALQAATVGSTYASNPHSEAAAMTAARAADVCLIPCRPGILDLRAIGSTTELCRIVSFSIRGVWTRYPDPLPGRRTAK